MNIRCGKGILLWNDELTSKLIGKTIRNAEVDGYRIAISFTDGTVFNYYPSDGGQSCWELIDGKENTDENPS